MRLDDRFMTLMTGLVLVIGIGALVQGTGGGQSILKGGSFEPRDDNFTVLAGRTQDLDVLLNDARADKIDTAALTIISRPACGRAVLVDGKIRLDGTAGCSEPLRIAYCVQVGDECAIANVNVTMLESDRKDAAEVEAPAVAAAEPAESGPVTKAVTGAVTVASAADAASADGDMLAAAPAQSDPLAPADAAPGPEAAGTPVVASATEGLPGIVTPGTAPTPAAPAVLDDDLPIIADASSATAPQPDPGPQAPTLSLNLPELPVESLSASADTRMPAITADRILDRAATLLAESADAGDRAVSVAALAPALPRQAAVPATPAATGVAAEPAAEEIVVARTSALPQIGVPSRLEARIDTASTAGDLGRELGPSVIEDSPAALTAPAAEAEAEDIALATGPTWITLPADSAGVSARSLPAAAPAPVEAAPGAVEKAERASFVPAPVAIAVAAPAGLQAELVQEPAPDLTLGHRHGVGDALPAYDQPIQLAALDLGGSLALADFVTDIPAAPAASVEKIAANDAAANAANASDAAVELARLNPTEKPQAPARPITPPAAANCDSGLTVTAETGAHLAVTIDSPCRAGTEAVVSHGGIAFTITLDQTGAAAFTFPALTPEGDVEVAFPDGAAVSGQAPVHDLDGVTRVAVTWTAPIDIDLHAHEFGAHDQDDGHVWAGHSRDYRTARRQGGGYLTALGPAGDAPGARTEIYSLPMNARTPDGMVDLALVATRPGALCGDVVGLRTVRSDESRDRDLAVRLDGCSGDAPLTINNVVHGIRVARN